MISGHNIYLSTLDDKVKINEIELKPEVDEDSLAEASLFEIKVPLLEFANANLRKVYNENIIDIGELLINAPDVVIKDILGNATEESKPSQMNDLQQLTKGFFKAVYVQKLEVENGSLVLDNHLRVRQDSLAFGKINFLLENFQLDDKYMSDTSLRIFLADNLRLEIEDYALKLSDNLHLFVADKILIDTQKDLLNVEGFKLKPFSLKRYFPCWINMAEQPFWTLRYRNFLLPEWTSTKPIFKTSYLSIILISPVLSSIGQNTSPRKMTSKKN